MKNTKFTVKTKSKNYTIYFGNNIINKTGKLIKKNLPNAKKVCILADTKIPYSILKILIRYQLKIRIFLRALYLMVTTLIKYYVLIIAFLVLIMDQRVILLRTLLQKISAIYL